ncbi:MAG: hypothetical protein IT449_13930 [Phycisphaerales bacterium]|nr:hypothetical protein [Phycisphaerales bacterium]
MSDFGENLWPNGESRLDGVETTPVDAARAAPAPPSEDAARVHNSSAEDFNTGSSSEPHSNLGGTLEPDAANRDLEASGDRRVEDGIEPFHARELTSLPPVVDEAKVSDDPAPGTAAETVDLDAAPQDAVPAGAAGYEPWEPNDQARHVAVELRRVEMEIRGLLENCDNKRKRRYEGTRRWLELMEDLVAMRYTGPADEATLAKVSALVARRMYLFNMLNFIVATRHRWNT